MRRGLITFILTSALLSIAVGFKIFPSNKCDFVTKRDAEIYLTQLFHSINNCKISTFRSLLTPNFEQFVFNGIRSRDDIVGVLRLLCTAKFQPRFVRRIIARQDPSSFAVELKTFKGSKLVFTLNNNYTLLRLRHCPRHFKTCFQLFSSVNHLRVSDLGPFEIPQ